MSFYRLCLYITQNKDNQGMTINIELEPSNNLQFICIHVGLLTLQEEPIVIYIYGCPYSTDIVYSLHPPARAEAWNDVRELLRG